MPPLDDENEVLDMDLDASPPVDEGQTASAESSPAQGEPERDTLSLVRDVVEKASTNVAASPAEGQEAGQQPGDQGTEKKLGAEDFDGLPFSKHPRFRELISQRKDLLKENDRLKEFETDAQRYRNVEGFLKQHDVPPDDAAFALTIIAQSRTDPVGTLEALKPWLQDLFTRAGVILPDDIQQGVNAGTYTPQSAQEIARLRAQTQSYQTQQQIAYTRQQEQQRVERIRGLVDTATSWEADRKAKDPNFAAKQALIAERVTFLQRIEGVPDTPEGVTKQLSKAYADINARFIPSITQQPRRVATRPVTGGQVSGSPRATPQSTMDVIRQHVRVGA